MVRIVGNNNMFLRIFKPLQVMYSEGKFKFSKSGITCTSVNPEHTAMLSISINKNFFKQYKINKYEEFGIDIEKIIKLLEKKTFKRMEHETTIVFDSKLDYGIIETIGKRTSHSGKFNLFPKEGISEPKVPNLELKWEYNISDLELLKNICEDIKSESNHIFFVGAKDNITLKADLRSYMKGDELSSYKLKTPEMECIRSDDKEAIGLYEVLDFWYFIWGVRQLFGKNARVTIEFDTDYPIRLTAKDKNIEILYLLAPRIESY